MNSETAGPRDVIGNVNRPILMPDTRGATISFCLFRGSLGSYRAWPDKFFRHRAGLVAKPDFYHVIGTDGAQDYDRNHQGIHQ